MQNFILDTETHSTVPFKITNTIFLFDVGKTGDRYLKRLSRVKCLLPSSKSPWQQLQQSTSIFSPTSGWSTRTAMTETNQSLLSTHTEIRDLFGFLFKPDEKPINFYHTHQQSRIVHLFVRDRLMEDALEIESKTSVLMGRGFQLR